MNSIINNNPMWWDTTLTIYNKHIDKVTDIITWHRHTVDNCFWKYSGDRLMVGTSVLETFGATCRIPVQTNFLPAFEWNNLPSDKKSDYLTLQQGDIIVLGRVDDIIDEYSSGHRSSDLVNKYKSLQGVVEIKYVIINVGAGRNNPHYLVRGL